MPLLYPDCLVTSISLEGALLSHEERRSILEDAIENWRDWNKPIDRIAGAGGGLTKKYSQFKRVQNRFYASTDIPIENFDALHMAEGSANEMVEGEIGLYATSRNNRIALSMMEIDSELASKARDYYLLYLQRCVFTYGYLFKQFAQFGPRYYIIGAGYGDPQPKRSYEMSLNVCHWRGLADRFGAGPQSLLLRDVYLLNFLNEQYLSAPFGKTASTLREWIKQDAGQRGTLKPFNEKIWVWEPPIERIPQLRYELFCAGRLFYWAFFPKHHGVGEHAKPNPWYRPNITAPWEPTDEIPEIFLPEYFDGRDPSLIY